MLGLLLCLVVSFSLYAVFLTRRSLALLHVRKSSSGLGATAASAAVHNTAAATTSSGNPATTSKYFFTSD